MRNLTGREVFKKYVALETSCLNQKEKEDITGMLFKYKDTFSLREEIGIYPIVVFEIDLVNKTPFLLDYNM